MSALADGMIAAAALAVPLGGAISFIWLRVERKIRELTRQHQECEEKFHVFEVRQIRTGILLGLAVDDMEANLPTSPVLRRLKRELRALYPIDETQDEEMLALLRRLHALD